MSVLRFLLGCALSSFVSVSSASADGDIYVGEKLAKEFCTGCHNVDPTGPFKLYPPSFASIAVYRSPVDIRGRILFRPLHSSMPQLGHMLTPDNVDNLVAYIASLENDM